MGLLDNIRDENGQIKKPILFSMIGAGGLLAYMFLKGGGTPAVVATGQTSALTPDLGGLANAIKGLSGGGGTASTPSLDPPTTGGTGSTTTDTHTTPTPLPPSGTTTYTGTPTAPLVGMSSGAAGGGGGGTGQVIQPIAKTQTVYGGLATAILPVASSSGPKSVAYKPGGTSTPTPTPAEANPRAAAPTFSPYVAPARTPATPIIATSNPRVAAPSFSPYVPPLPTVPLAPAKTATKAKVVVSGSKKKIVGTTPVKTAPAKTTVTTAHHLGYQ